MVFSLEVAGCSRRTSVDTADLCYSKWNIWPCLFSEIDPTLCFKFIFIYQGKYVSADPVFYFLLWLFSSLSYWGGLDQPVTFITFSYNSSSVTCFNEKNSTLDSVQACVLTSHFLPFHLKIEWRQRTILCLWTARDGGVVVFMSYVPIDRKHCSTTMFWAF